MTARHVELSIPTDLVTSPPGALSALLTCATPPDAEQSSSARKAPAAGAQPTSPGSAGRSDGGEGKSKRLPSDGLAPPHLISTLFILTHSAGGSKDSPLLAAVATGLVTHNPSIAVLRFDFPYRSARSNGPPDRQPKLIESVAAVVSHVLSASFASFVADAAAPASLALANVYLGGASMGCRAVASFVNSFGHLYEHLIAGLVFYAYPLHPANDPSKLRDGPLLLLDRHTRVCFIQGTRDRLCSAHLMTSVKSRMAARHETHLIESADHSFNVLKSSPLSTADVFDSIIATTLVFFNEPISRITISVPPSAVSSPTAAPSALDPSAPAAVSRKRNRSDSNTPPPPPPSAPAARAPASPPAAPAAVPASPAVTNSPPDVHVLPAFKKAKRSTRSSSAAAAAATSSAQ